MGGGWVRGPACGSCRRIGRCRRTPRPCARVVTCSFPSSRACLMHNGARALHLNTKSKFANRGIREVLIPLYRACRHHAFSYRPCCRCIFPRVQRLRRHAPFQHRTSKPSPRFLTIVIPSHFTASWYVLGRNHHHRCLEPVTCAIATRLYRADHVSNDRICHPPVRIVRVAPQFASAVLP